MRKLYEIAHARSGDKGNNVNIAIFANTQKDYEFLKIFLTEEKVFLFFQELKPIHVKRYEVPNLQAFNFILTGVLEGGGSLSLRVDAQGKALGQALLELEF